MANNPQKEVRNGVSGCRAFGGVEKLCMWECGRFPAALYTLEILDKSDERMWMLPLWIDPFGGGKCRRYGVEVNKTFSFEFDSNTRTL